MLMDLYFNELIGPREINILVSYYSNNKTQNMYTSSGPYMPQIRSIFSKV